MRNILLYVSPFAGGKTELIGVTKRVFRGRGIPFEERLISDSDYLMRAVERDHSEARGIHHIHAHGESPHPHAFNPTSEHMTFINVSPHMQALMFEDFFAELSKPRDSGKYYFAELATGVNRTPPELITANNDYSNRSLTDGLRSGRYATGWVDRVAAVIHIGSRFELRDGLNEARRLQGYELGQDVKGERSRPLPPEVMLFTKQDDFRALYRYLYEDRMLGRRIMSIENDGSPRFFREGIAAILERVDHGAGLEGGAIQKEMR